MCNSGLKKMVISARPSQFFLFSLNAVDGEKVERLTVHVVVGSALYYPPLSKARYYGPH